MAGDGAIGGLRPETSNPALGQQRVSPVRRSPDSPLTNWDRTFILVPQQVPGPRAAAPSPNAAFPSFLPPRQPQQERPIEVVIGCKGSKTAANPFLPHEMAKGSTWSPARAATCNTSCRPRQPSRSY